MASNFLFDGGKFDLNKQLSPVFQVSHSFSTGSQIAPSAYNFSAVYAGQKAR
jgi:mitochondrial import receptor subunit TOM40